MLEVKIHFTITNPNKLARMKLGKIFHWGMIFYDETTIPQSQTIKIYLLISLLPFVFDETNDEKILRYSTKEGVLRSAKPWGRISRCIISFSSYRWMNQRSGSLFLLTMCYTDRSYMELHSRYGSIKINSTCISSTQNKDGADVGCREPDFRSNQQGVDRRHPFCGKNETDAISSTAT